MRNAPTDAEKRNLAGLPPPTAPDCSTCAWCVWDAQHGEGECRRHAPRDTERNPYGVFIRQWPTVVTSDRCGDWVPVDGI